jgi:hypothetical protein
MRRCFAILCALLTSLLTTSTVAAQEERGMSEEQLALYLKANEALRAEPPRAREAAEALEDALEAGDRFATLVLTAGRAYQLMDECPDATRLFNEFDVAPLDARSDREALTDLRAYYQKQMKTLCSARITIECSSAEIELSIGEREPVCGEELKLPPGTYDIEAKLGESTRQSTISVEGNEQLVHRVELREEKPAPTVKLDPPEDQDRGVDRGISRSTLIAGASTLAIVGGASTFWLLARRSHDNTRQEYEALEDRSEDDFQQYSSLAQRQGKREVIAGWTAVGCLAAGSLLTIGLVVRDLKRPDAKTPSTSLMLSPDGVSIRASF